MASVDSPAHFLSLKVMRVSRPGLANAWQPFYSSSPSFSAHSSASILSLQGPAPLGGHPKTLRDLSTTDLLTLPSSFGSIQLGETFTSCLCVNNESQMAIDAVHFKVEMQTVTTKVVLLESDGSGQRLTAGHTLEWVVHHEIKELGQHVLACSVTYRLPPHARAIPGASEDVNDPTMMTFRKFYKFAVTNPLSVRTKVHTPKSPSAQLSSEERGKVFLEIHIQNLTQQPLYLHRMLFECVDGWDAISNSEVSDSEHVDSAQNLSVLNPQDMHQYIYVLTRKNYEIAAEEGIPGNIVPLGRLDISWRSNFGEPGRLLTSMLSRRIPTVPVAQPASAIPPYIKRNATAPPASRPQSPQLLHSRPSTPPIVPRSESPSLNRPNPMAIMRPSSPLHTNIVSPASNLEINLTVRKLFPSTITVEQQFAISFSLSIATNIPPGLQNKRRMVSVFVQHFQSHRIISSTAPIAPAPSFHMDSPSGISSPISAIGELRVPHGGASDPGRVNQEQHGRDEEIIRSGDSSAILLPSPFSDGVDEAVAQSNEVNFVGPSVISLPPYDLSPRKAQNSRDLETLDKVEASQDFELPFIAFRKGFATVGGVRILLKEDCIFSESDESAGTGTNDTQRARLLKQYDVVGEIWISA